MKILKDVVVTFEAVYDKILNNSAPSNNSLIQKGDQCVDSRKDLLDEIKSKYILPYYRLYQDLDCRGVSLLKKGFQNNLFDDELPRAKFFKDNKNLKKIEEIYDADLTFQAGTKNVYSTLMTYAFSGSKNRDFTIAAKLIIEYGVPFELCQRLAKNHDPEGLVTLLHINAKSNENKIEYPLDIDILTTPEITTDLTIRYAVARLNIKPTHQNLRPLPESLDETLNMALDLKGITKKQFPKIRETMPRATSEMKRNILRALAIGTLSSSRLSNSNTSETDREFASYLDKPAVIAFPYFNNQYHIISQDWISELENTDIKTPEESEPIERAFFGYDADEYWTSQGALSKSYRAAQFLRFKGKVSSFGSKVEDLLKITSLGKKVKELNIIVHGYRKGAIQFINDKGHVFELSKSNLHKYEKIFRQLAPFTKGGVVYISACDLGYNPEVYDMLARLAEMMECTVKTGTIVQDLHLNNGVDGDVVVIARPDGHTMEHYNPDVTWNTGLANFYEWWKS